VLISGQNYEIDEWIRELLGNWKDRPLIDSWEKSTTILDPGLVFQLANKVIKLNSYLHFD
jgi:hypothetical protein